MRRKKASHSDKETNNRTTIIVAVLGLLGTIATAYFGFLASTRPSQMIIDATQTSEARSSMMSPAVASATSILAVENKEASIGTATALAGYYRADEIGIPIQFENFSIWSIE